MWKVKPRKWELRESEGFNEIEKDILNMGLFLRTALGLSMQKQSIQRNLTGVFCISCQLPDEWR